MTGDGSKRLIDEAHAAIKGVAASLQGLASRSSFASGERTPVWVFGIGASSSVGIAELLRVKVRLSTGLRPLLRVRVWVLRTHSHLSVQRLLLLCEAWQHTPGADGTVLGLA